MTVLTVQYGIVGEGAWVLLRENQQLKKLSVVTSSPIILFYIFNENYTKIKSLQMESCNSAASVWAVKKDGDLPVGFTSSAARSVLEDPAVFSPWDGSLVEMHIYRPPRFPHTPFFLVTGYEINAWLGNASSSEAGRSISCKA